MEVRIPCACPVPEAGPRHEEDVLTYADELPYREAIAAQKDMAFEIDEDDDESTSGDALAALTEQYVLRGLTAWTLVDLAGDPIEPTRQAIRGYILSSWRVAQVVSEAVEPLYNPQVLLPLVKRAERLSQRGPTDDSTSARTSSRKRPPKPSKPSSTSTSRTDGIGTPMSLPGGDSRSSPSVT